ncbi:YkuS family protein [Natroniella sulfidigena]|uniref:YkuS family protein n=1 Tax=Natroniella sulfidigena TaxID=723921 RepID=UPI00200AA221|nr:YkuS family protein [Natroniella sulfidigena]MCK8818009.1 YkuS family protein [Natroniella sulfidigena]
MSRIAIEGDLNNIKEELQATDHDVVNLTQENMQNADAIILTGADNNTMDIADTETNAQIINAQGMSAEQVREQLENRLI